MDTLLHYNLRYCLEPTAEDAEEEARLQAEAAAAAEGGDGAAAAQQRVRGAVSEPPLRFRPAVHRACAFPVRLGWPGAQGSGVARGLDFEGLTVTAGGGPACGGKVNLMHA